LAYRPEERGGWLAIHVRSQIAKGVEPDLLPFL
jgi:hypothetical protein